MKVRMKVRMKALSLTALLLLVAALATCPAYAQQSSDGQVSSEQAGMDTPPGTGSPSGAGSPSGQGTVGAAPEQAWPSAPEAGRGGEMPGAYTTQGVVSNIDATNNVVDVAGQRLRVTDRTQFSSAAGAAQATNLSSLPYGEQVRATWRREGGQAVATSIEVLSSAGGAAGTAAAPSSQQPDPVGGGGDSTGQPGQTVQGNISRIDQDNKTIDVAGQRLHIDDNTAFTAAAGAAPARDFSSLRQGERVQASYRREGDKNVANSIEVLPSAGAAAPSAAAAGGAAVAAPQQQRGQGAGGAQAAQTAPGLTTAQLGQPAYVLIGKAQKVEPDRFSLVITTSQGNQPLNITAQSAIRDNNDNPIKLSDIGQGDRILAAFRRVGGENVVTQLVKLQ